MVGEGSGGLKATDDAPEGFPLLSLELAHAFLHRPSGHETVDEGGPLPTEAVGSVDGLFLGGRGRPP